MTSRKHSALYRYIEELHGDRPWGRVLDAGTGINSIGWLQDLETDQWTAVTGSRAEADLVQNAISPKKRSQDQIIVGNWADTSLLQDKTYDVILADYLMGAIEGFAPYFQTFLFRRLRLMSPQSLYVTGLEPYVATRQPDTEAGRLIWEIGRFRDACVLLSGGHTYREYPFEWVGDQLQQAGFIIGRHKHFKIAYRQRFVDGQIRIAFGALDAIDDHAVTDALRRRGQALREAALELIDKEGALRFCRNYVIEATPRD